MLHKLKQELNHTTTQNGAVTNKSSLSAVLDYFAQGSALRNRELSSKIDLFNKAYLEDKLLALKILFYSRDIRGGQGERNTFKELIHHIALTDPSTLEKNIHLIPFFGRWDDIYSLFGTSLEFNAVNLIKAQLEEDLKSDNPSLLGKWLKSENTSSLESRKLATKTRLALNMTSRDYRKMLSKLRAKIDILETKLSKKNYASIDYSKIPSQAGMKYRASFARNDEQRYTKYIESLVSGEVKANVGTLAPYQVVSNIFGEISPADRNLYNSIWRDLPNYLGDSKENSMAVIDVSGSMLGLPMEMAISIGLYLAEKNSGAFANHFITFESQPRLIKIEGNDFCDKVLNIKNAPWGGSTNIEETFMLILNTAIKHNLSQAEMPTRLFIVSDMEFNEISGSYYDYEKKKTIPCLAWNNTLFEEISSRFKNAGYTMPKLVFWNVNSVQNNVPMTMEDNAQLVSGPNTILFETLLKGEFLSAYNIMMMEIDKERYSCITI